MDTDGDLVLVVDNEIMKLGIDRNASIVIDIEDKVATLAEADTPENLLKVVLRGMHSLIGETSNCATTYHNKMPQTFKQKRLYDKYVDLLSVINGKAIDSAKTGVIFNIPRNIAKYGKPLPYFMKYAGEYYKSLKKFLKSRSNMNLLCFEIEKWHTGLKWGKRNTNFDWTIMLDESIPIDEPLSQVIETIYLDYNKEFAQLKKDERIIRENLGGPRQFEINWDSFYEKYREKCRTVCPDGKALANIIVRMCYEKYPSRTKGFMWSMAGDEVADNIKQVPVLLPTRDEVNGTFEYLGKKYRLEQIGEDCHYREV